MNKKIILTILMLLTITLVKAELKADYDLCESTREIRTNCTMITPSITCPAYTYDILNLSGGAEVDTGNLALFNDSLYYFNFTLGEGEYVIRLCDNTTREVRVVEEESDMLPAIVILIPMLLGIILVIAALSMHEEHAVLKIFLFGSSFICVFISIHWGVIALSRLYSGLDDLINEMGTTTTILGIIFGLIITYWLIYMIYKGVRMAAQEKENKLEY